MKVEKMEKMEFQDSVLKGKRCMREMVYLLLKLKK